jgi:hypothetical protein
MNATARRALALEDFLKAFDEWANVRAQILASSLLVGGISEYDQGREKRTWMALMRARSEVTWSAAPEAVYRPEGL